jgi:hypothetical protein
MLRKQDLNAGKCYVNYGSRVARVVLAAREQIVTFITYHLDTGNSCGSASECTKADFIRWADHEATPTELAKLESLETGALFRDLPSPDRQALTYGAEIKARKRVSVK